MKKRALFLDRDGVMCHMVQYPEGFDSPQRPEDIRLVASIERVIEISQKKNWKVIEISNQPGVAKGKQIQELSDAIEARMHFLLKENGVSVDATYICQHHPKGVIPELTMECDCRKPKPGLLLKAAQEHNIDLSQSIFYGDKASDVQASVAAGCKSMILLHSEDLPEKVKEAQSTPVDYKVQSHKEACEIISAL